MARIMARTSGRITSFNTLIRRVAFPISAPILRNLVSTETTLRTPSSAFSNSRAAARVALETPGRE